MSKFFKYKRVAQVTKKDAEGNAIPKKDEQGVVVKGQFETEDKEFLDVLNIDKIIRVHMINEEHVIVLLDDGHEATHKEPALKNPAKPAIPSNIIEVKTRIWEQSEISIKGAEVAELYAALQSS